MSYRDEQRFRASQEVLARVLEGEAVLLDLASGRYLGLNRVGTVAWESLSSGASFGEALAAIEQRFDVDRPTARADLTALLADLTARGLLTPA